MITIPQKISDAERKYLEAALALIGTAPQLESIWLLMDLAWQESGCDPKTMGHENLQRFYSHPVWLLNGLFIEQHPLSLAHRESFAAEISRDNPSTVCDYGGGYGGLVRLIAKKSAETVVDHYDPYPHPSALELSASFKNVRHMDRLDGPYDVMIATDVFEHVADPLLEVEKTCRYLKVGGKYLIANCFYPVIKCHLPCTFHFRDSFNTILAEMNLRPVASVAYGTIFEKLGDVLVTPRIRRLEKKSRVRFASQQCLDAFRELRRQWLDKSVA